MSNLSLRPYQPGDEQAILELFSVCYPGAMAPAAWAWRFRDNPAGAGVITLAWDGATLAAHYAVTSLAMGCQGRAVAAGLSGTTMTRPAYRGRRLFPLLGRETYDRMCAAGMGMVWGFPNHLSHRGFIRDLEWADIYEVPKFLWQPAGTAAVASSVDVPAELPEFDDRFDALWARVGAGMQLAVRRDRRHLDWRYARHPDQRYRILAAAEPGQLLGYAVFKRYQDEFQVVDLLSLPDPAIGERLVLRVAELALAEGAAGVSLWLNVAHPLHAALEKLGFRNAAPITYLGGRAWQPDLVPIARDYRNWHVTMGDSDVF